MKGNLLIWWSALFASIGAVLTGYYDGCMSGMLEMDGFQSYFNIFGNSSEQSSCLSHEWDVSLSANGSEDDQMVGGSGCSSGQSADADFILGVIVSVTCLGSALGSLIAGWLADHLSRKYTLLMGGVTFFIGSILLAGAFHMALFIIGRGICGVGVGIMFMVIPVYIAEISPAASRGTLGSLIGPGYAGGILLGHLFNVGLSRICVGWRVSTAIQALGGLAFAVGTKWLPHTPRYLVMAKRDQEALNVLHKMNHQSSGNEDFVDTYLELENLKSSRLSAKNENGSKFCDRYRDLCQQKYITRLLIMFVLFFLAAFMGTFIFYFIPTLFCRVGVVPFISSLAVGFIMVVASVVLIFSIEKVGRKVSLLVGAGANILLAIGVGVLAHVFSTSNQAVAYTIVVLISIYTFAYSYSWLVIPFIIVSEVFPINLRGLTVSVSTFFFWIFIFLFSQVTPLIIGSPMQVHGFFYLLTAVNLFGVIFTLLSLPETKGVSLEEMDTLFSKRCYATTSVRKSHQVNLVSPPGKSERKDSSIGLKTDF